MDSHDHAADAGLTSFLTHRSFEKVLMFTLTHSCSNLVLQKQPSRIQPAVMVLPVSRIPPDRYAVHWSADSAVVLAVGISLVSPGTSAAPQTSSPTVNFVKTPVRLPVCCLHRVSGSISKGLLRKMQIWSSWSLRLLSCVKGIERVEIPSKWALLLSILSLIFCPLALRTRLVTILRCLS